MGLPNSKSALPGSSRTLRSIGHTWLLPLYVFIDWLVGLIQVNANAAWSPVRMMTATALAANTYNPVTQTKTANSNGALGTIDGVAPAVGDRVYDNSAATASQRGFFTVTSLGGTGSKWTMQRTPDADVSADFVNGKTFNVGSEGTTNGSTTWALTNTTSTFVLDTTTPTIEAADTAGALTVAGVQTNTGIKSFTTLTLAVWNAGKTFVTSFASAATAARTFTLPDWSGTPAQATVASGSTTPGAGGGTAPAFVPGAMTKVLAGATIAWAANVGTISAGGAGVAAHALRGGIVNDGTLWGIVEDNSALTATTGTITMLPLPTGSVPTGTTIDAYAQASDTVASHTHAGAAHTHVQS